MQLYKRATLGQYLKAFVTYNHLSLNFHIYAQNDYRLLNGKIK